MEAHTGNWQFNGNLCVEKNCFFFCDDTPSAIDHEGDESLSPKTKTYFDNIHFIENLF